MIQKQDTIKVLLISNEYKVHKNNDNIIVIEQKNKNEKTKEFYETSLFGSFFIPLILLLISFLIARWWFRKKEKKENEKLEAEIEKIREDINTLQNSFQPIVLSTIQLTQEKLVEDKISALKEIVNFRYKLFSIDQDYKEGEPLIEDTNEYHQSVYGNISNSVLNEIKETVLMKGYLFPKNIKDNMNLLIYELREICNIQKREYSIQEQKMPDKVISILNRLSEKFNVVIDDIRKDLHIDDSFIHDFIEKYKKIEK